jgi:hypothetical protein
MNMSTDRKPTTLFWIVTVVAVIWNAIGVMTYFMQVYMSEEAMAALPEAQQALYSVQPAWVTGAFAIAVFAGLAGSIALAWRSGLATAILVVSLVAVVCQFFYALVLSDMLAVMGPGSAVLPVVIVVIAAALVWFSAQAKSKGWIS